MVPNNTDLVYCETHAKMHDEWIIPKKCHATSRINKMKLSELETEYAKLGSITQTQQPLCKKMKKTDFVERILAHYESKCFRSVGEPTEKAKTAGEIDLVTIGRAIRQQLDSDPAIENVTHVVIENQISTIASRMKTIQGMIAQYFIMRFGDRVYIEFVSSHNKLKGFAEKTREDVCVATTETESTAKKLSYKANKKDGITICKRFFDSNPEMRGWQSYFDKSKKRDDLADCFLQGVWFLKHHKIIHYADNLKINSVIVS